MEMDKETLERLYWQQNLSMPEIMEKLGVTEKKLTYWMNKHGIKRRNKSEALSLYNRKYGSYNRKYFFDEEWKQLYAKGLSTCKIAEKYGCSQSVVWRRLKQLRIEITRLPQPILTNRFVVGYLAGVLKGDGYIQRRNGHSPRLHIDTISKKFTNNIYRAEKEAGLRPRVNKYERQSRFGKYEWRCRYYSIRVTIPESFAVLLENFDPYTREEKIGFVRGVFDSEGSAGKKKYNGVIYHTIRIFNENIELLEKLSKIICDFGIEMKLYRRPKGSCIAVQTKEGFERFLEVFGGKFSKRKDVDVR